MPTLADAFMAAVLAPLMCLPFVDVPIIDVFLPCHPDLLSFCAHTLDRGFGDAE
jgi:hypothetical protein